MRAHIKWIDRFPNSWEIHEEIDDHTDLTKAMASRAMLMSILES